MAPGDIHELRIPNAGREGTISGYFDSPEKMTAAVLKMDGKYAGVYITLNPCKPELLARICNRFIPYAKLTTSDHDILCRQWLLIDCDPKRPGGISSTDAEHGRAITTACSIWDSLRGEGWPDPVVADSGIANLYATDDFGVDLTVFNAARITKAYGTLTRKGDSTAERPHRRSRLLEIPSALQELEITA